MKWNPFKKKKPAKRSYAAASTGRLFYSWLHPGTSSNAEIQPALATIRNHSRELCRNNDYAKKYLSMCKTNIIGPSGIILQAKVKNDTGESQDGKANQLIEDQWKEWGLRGNCSVDGTLSWLDIQKIFVESIARDGEILIRLVKGWNNRWNFAIQLLEADYLDETYDNPGKKIKMGIEVDSWNRPQSYYLLKFHPGDRNTAYQGDRYQAFPWSEIIHAYIPERPGQLRGVPHMHASMTRLHHVGEYEEAELVAARVGAAKMGFYKRPADVVATISGDGKDNDGNLLKSAEPGTMEELPPGVDFVPWSPDHPTDGFPAFIKATLRGISAGLNVSYNSLAGDLESVNYSSYRAGSLEERDNWRLLQSWVIQTLCTPVYREWLYWSMVSKAVPLPVNKFDKFLNVVWRPRGWDWVDPEKDIEATRKEIMAGLKTRSQVAAEKGLELEDIYQQLAEEEKLAKKYGLDLKLEKDTSQNENKNGSSNQTV